MKTVTVYCLPYTGASATYFYAWQRRLPEWISICPIEPAGRGDRMEEPFYADFDEAVQDMEGRIQEHLTPPYLLLGSCMGAILCYELALLLRRKGAASPSHLVALGQGCPARRNEFARLAGLNDEQLIRKVRGMGGDPERRLDDPELSAFYLPVSRADCRIYDDYVPSRERLSCPITVIGGSEDPLNPPFALEEWRDYTEGPLAVQLVDGGHYFMERQSDAILKTLLTLSRQAWEEAATRECSRLCK